MLRAVASGPNETNACGVALFEVFALSEIQGRRCSTAPAVRVSPDTTVEDELRVAERTAFVTELTFAELPHARCSSRRTPNVVTRWSRKNLLWRTATPLWKRESV